MNGMQSYGGHFAKALGMAIVYADMANLRKIYDNWPDEWKRYSEMWKQQHENDED